MTTGCGKNIDGLDIMAVSSLNGNRKNYFW